MLPGGRGNLPFNKAVIDKYPATSATTIDLSSQTYQSVSKLRSKLLSKAQSLIDYPDGARVLRVGIRDDWYITPTQQLIIDEVRAQLSKQGIQTYFIPIR